MPESASALLVTADKAQAGELARLLMTHGLALQVVGTKSSELDVGGAELMFVDVSTDFGLALRAAPGRRAPECAVLAITPATLTRLGLQAARSGAADFVRYPFEAEELSYVVGKVQKGLERVADSPPPSRLLGQGSQMIAGSPAMNVLLSLLQARGQRHRHRAGARRERLRQGAGGPASARLEPAQGGAVREGALRRAARTTCSRASCSATRRARSPAPTARKPGRVELAEGGTLFLDEIGDITLPCSSSCCACCKSGSSSAWAAPRRCTADVRFVAATHRDLEARVHQGEFREDLFYRLNVVSLWVPPCASVRPTSSLWRCISATSPAAPTVVPACSTPTRLDLLEAAAVAGQRAAAAELHRAPDRAGRETRASPSARSRRSCRGWRCRTMALAAVGRLQPGRELAAEQRGRSSTWPCARPSAARWKKP